MESTVADTQAVASAQGWEEELQELQRRHEFAEKMGGPEAIARHHEAGRLTIRERIGQRADAESFQEVGKLTGQGQYVQGRLQGVT